MTLAVFVTLAIAALLTSMVSAVLGMGGGILLLAVMSSFMEHGDLIPTHAAVQIASNGTRVLAFLRDVDRGTFVRFIIGVIPGGCIGMLLLWSLGEPHESEAYLKTLIGAFILVVTYLPRGKKGSGDAAAHWWDFPVMGLLAGTAALTVGAVGPLIAPIFARRNFVKDRLIATKAVCQLATHFMKIPAFIWLRNLDLSTLGPLALVMIVMVIPGTLIGKKFLQGISPRAFTIAYRVALTTAGLKVLLYDGIYHLPVWG